MQSRPPHILYCSKDQLNRDVMDMFLTVKGFTQAYCATMDVVWTPNDYPTWTECVVTDDPEFVTMWKLTFPTYAELEKEFTEWHKMFLMMPHM